MKRFITFFVVLTIFYAFPTLGEITDGLVVHYELDGNAVESTGNGIDGVIIDPGEYITACEDRFGNENSALSFAKNGNKSKKPYIDLEIPTGQNGINTSIDSYNTVAFWMYWDRYEDGCPDPSVIFTWELYGLGISPSLGFGFFTHNGDIYGILYNEENVSKFANKWVHITAVFHNGSLREEPPSESSYSKLYINGILQELRDCSSKKPTNGNAMATASAQIGNITRDYSCDYDYNGRLDDFRIFNRELSIEEIEYLAEANLPNPPTLTSPLNGATNQPTALRMEWNSSINAVSYALQVAKNNIFTDLVLDVNDLPDTYYDLAGLDNSQTYWWRVKAKNEQGHFSAWSEIWTFSTAIQIQIDLFIEGISFLNSRKQDTGNVKANDLCDTASSVRSALGSRRWIGPSISCRSVFSRRLCYRRTACSAFRRSLAISQLTHI